jgi:hypothetical protein
MGLGVLQYKIRHVPMLSDTPRSIVPPAVHVVFRTTSSHVFIETEIHVLVLYAEEEQSYHDGHGRTAH